MQALADRTRNLPAAREAHARATSSEIHPPIDEPTRTCGPVVSAPITATARISQRRRNNRFSNSSSDWICPMGQALP